MSSHTYTLVTQEVMDDKLRVPKHTNGNILQGFFKFNFTLFYQNIFTSVKVLISFTFSVCEKLLSFS